MNISNFKPGQGEEVKTDDKPISPRSMSRRAALQALYQWQLNQAEAHDIIKQFHEDGLLESTDIALFQEIVAFVSSHADDLDACYRPYLDRAVAMIDPVEKNILRIGVYELQEKMEIPYRVVINEAVELAKSFGAEESHKYINGILDKVAQTLRTLETQA